MIRTWKMLFLPALVAVVLTAAPVRADGTDTKKDKDSDKLDLILLQLADLQRSLQKMQRENDDRDELIELRMREFRARLSDLEQKIEKMAKERVSGYYNPDGLKNPSFKPTEDVEGHMATVRIQNNSQFICTVTINGLTQRVAPGQFMSAIVPAGTFNYEVVSDGFGFLRRNTLPVLANSVRDMEIR